MEQSLVPRALWTNDSKFLHHHVPDFFTSVQVTQDIPAGVSFGPCVLHNTIYDTIAFIALKSFDRGGKAYVFRVDPDALKSSPLVVPWLRLVQAAMDAEEQNTEAYLKAGQLYFRTIRDISQGEELLVWYDEELSHLLGFSDIKTRALTDGYSCGKCGLAFKHENPFLAHCRFLCTQVKVDIVRGESEQKHAETRRQRSVTDFHNIARDLEHKKSGSSEDRKRRNDEALSPKCRKPVLLEKKNMANHNNMTHVNKDFPHDHDFTEPTIKVSSSPTSKSKSAKSSAFVESKKTKSDQPSKAGDITRENPSVSTLQLDREAALGLQSDSSAFLLWGAHADQKSAFCKPSRLSIPEDQQHQRPIGVSDDVTEQAALGYRHMLSSHLFQGDLPSTQTVSPAIMSAPVSLHYAPDVWCRNISGPLQPTSSLRLLPPTLSSMAVTVQNWCAKCNLSFRMTSDLVFHMRSHHKKEFAAEAQSRRRREEKLTCPICHEYFRERHHLSRHMTSHN
ncbi:PR domain zinc finger protein 8 [Tachysurus fulvidraco]|uniref:PR domain zinc finger protein 8 n=1 Tax=Tachysurus fulvidraco TaxID=1234273 RepID=UPI001FEF944C|nr:PR domain zinc finger protein 8 [Tachysurus fulvidraco]